MRQTIKRKWRKFWKPWINSGSSRFTTLLDPQYMNWEIQVCKHTLFRPSYTTSTRSGLKRELKWLYAIMTQIIIFPICTPQWVGLEPRITALRFKSIGLSYITLSSVCRLLTAISLLHTTEWDIESHSWTMRSNPAVRNCDKEGWAASAQSSSVWPSTTGLNPRFSEPTRIQLRVVPTMSCEPRPSDTVRIPPKCSAIWNWNVKFEWFKIPILPS